MKPRRILKFIAMGAVAALVLPLTPTQAQTDSALGKSPDRAAVGLGHLYHPFSPAPGIQASFPHMALIDDVDARGRRVPEIWMGYSRGPDSVDNVVSPGVLVSRDGGGTFLEDRGGTDLEPLAMIRRSNGEYIAPRFIPEYDNGRVTVTTRVSNDRGGTWTDRKGIVKPPQGMTFTNQGFDRGLRVHKNAMELPDGRILVGAYGKFAQRNRWSAMLLSTTDGGASWDVWGIINDKDHVGASEPSFSRTRDGRLIAILRGAPESDGLMQAYSSDDGRTWTTPQKVKAPTDTVKGAVEPSIVLQPNGVLVLAYGRPGNHVLTSQSGNGDDWGNYELVFSNTPVRNTEAHWGSSANMTMVPLDSNRSLILGDTCAPWGCQPHHETWAIWARTVDAVGPGTGKLDLRGLVQSGKAKITGDVMTNPLFPQTRAAGAVDGSADKHAAAELADGGKLVLELDRPYKLKSIGVLLTPGVASGADVELSMDGVGWSGPVLQLRDRVDHSVIQHDIEPAEARFVRISPVGRQHGVVTEIELYTADTDTFENDPILQGPRGWTHLSYAEVLDTVSLSGRELAGRDSRRALRLLDFDDRAMASARRPFAPRKSVEITYDWMPVNRQTGTLLTIMGKDAAGKEISPYHFSIDPIGRGVNQYDGKRWNRIGNLPRTIDSGQWNEVTFKADGGGARLTINGQSMTANPPSGAPVVLNQLQFSSSGTSPRGSSMYFDNIRIR